MCLWKYYCMGQGIDLERREAVHAYGKQGTLILKVTFKDEGDGRELGLGLKSEILGISTKHQNHALKIKEGNSRSIMLIFSLYILCILQT